MAKHSIGIRRTPGQKAFRVFAYALCIFLAILSLFPFIIMLVNATRDTPSIQSNPISLVFGTNPSPLLTFLHRQLRPDVQFFISGEQDIALAVAIFCPDQAQNETS